MSKLFWGVKALSLLLLISPLANAASFNCKKASTKIEKSICSNPVLSKLDSQLSILYQTTRLLGYQSVKKDQKQWLKKRDITCKKASEKCLEMLYSERKVELNKILLADSDPIYIESITTKIPHKEGWGVTLETIKFSKKYNRLYSLLGYPTPEQAIQDMKSRIKSDDWISGKMNYVILNSKNVLSVCSSEEGASAYPSTNSFPCDTFNIKTSQRINQDTLFKKNKLHTLCRIIQKKMNLDLQTSMDYIKQSEAGVEPTILDYWKDFSIYQKNLCDDVSLGEMVVGDDGIVFSHELKLPHRLLGVSPSGHYTIPYETLVPFFKDINPLQEFYRYRIQMNKINKQFE